MYRPILGFLAVLVALPSPVFAVTPVLSGTSVSITPTPIVQIVLTQTASITVLDAVQKPVSGTVVTVYTNLATSAIADDKATAGTSDAKATTDAQGKVTFTLAAGTYTAASAYYDGSWTHTSQAPFTLTTSVPTNISTILDTYGANVLVHVYDTVNVGQGMSGATVGMYTDQSMGKMADDLSKMQSQVDAQGVTSASGDVGFLLAPGKYYYRMAKGSLTATGTVDAVLRTATNVGIRLPGTTAIPTIPVVPPPCTPLLTSALGAPCTPPPTTTQQEPCPSGQINVGTTASPICRPIPPPEEPCTPTVTTAGVVVPCTPPPTTGDTPCPTGTIKVEVQTSSGTIEIVCRPIPSGNDSTPTSTTPCPPVLNNALGADPCTPAPTLTTGEEECPEGTKLVKIGDSDWCMGTTIAVATKFDLQAETVALNEAEIITFSIKNTGQVKVNSFVYELRWIGTGDEVVGTYRKEVKQALLPGKTYKNPLNMSGKDWKDFLAKRPLNSKYLRLVVDPEQKLTETNEGNNEKEMRPLTTGARDLQISDLSTKYTSSPFVDTFSFKIKNTGIFRIKGYTTKIDWVDADGAVVAPDTYLDYSFSTTLKLGQQVSFPLSYQKASFQKFMANMPGRAYALRVTVNPAAPQVDTNPVNNTSKLGKLRDLTVASVGFTADEMPTFILRNSGNTPIYNFAYSVQWLNKDGQPMNTLQTNYGKTLKPGQTLTDPIAVLSAAWPSFLKYRLDHPEVVASFRVVIDPKDEILESNEENNEMMLASPTVYGRDIKASDIYFKYSSSPFVDTFGFKIKNIGTFNIKGYAMDINWVDADGVVIPSAYLTYTYNGTLKVGQELSFPTNSQKAKFQELLLAVPGRAHSLRVSVKPAAPQVDLDLANNVISSYRSRDIKVGSVTFTSDTVPAFTLKNESNTPIYNFAYSVQWLNKDGQPMNTLQTNYGKTLKPGQTLTDPIAVLSAAWPSFLKYRLDHPEVVASFRVVIDPKDEILETSEENNQKALSLPLPILPLSISL